MLSWAHPAERFTLLSLMAIKPCFLVMNCVPRCQPETSLFQTNYLYIRVKILIYPSLYWKNVLFQIVCLWLRWKEVSTTEALSNKQSQDLKQFSCTVVQEKSNTHVPALPFTSGFVCHVCFHWLQKALLWACRGGTQLFQAEFMGNHLILCFNYEDTCNFKALSVAYVFLLRNFFF